MLGIVKHYASHVEARHDVLVPDTGRGGGTITAIWANAVTIELHLFYSSIRTLKERAENHLLPVLPLSDAKFASFFPRLSRFYRVPQIFPAFFVITKSAGNTLRLRDGIALGTYLGSLVLWSEDHQRMPSHMINQ